ncbi:MAG: MarC family protein [Planctomycetaceae bacterium]
MAAMDTDRFIDSIVLMLVLFNPLLMSAYLHDVMSTLPARTFGTVIIRAFIISGLTFAFFAWAGDRFFSSVLQVRFAAFLIFGGLVFLIIAIRYIVIGAEMICQLRGDGAHLAGSIAMPIMIGPGTISASVLAGSELPIPLAWLSIGIALFISCLLLIAMKSLFDYVHERNEQLVERYVEAVGRASALVIGTIAVEMLMKGIELWQT